MRDIVRFLKDNPQATILLAICLILGLGTLIAIMLGIASSGPGTPNPNDPDSGLIVLFHVVAGW